MRLTVTPRETKFRKKHAEFFGRLRGTGKAKLRLSYEIVSENLDGSRKVDVRQTEVVVAIPEKSAGPKGISQQWARRQNEHFAELLQYYPNETFFQYVLLQSRDRYGVVPPSLGDRPWTRSQTETELYHLFSGSAAVQQALQRQALRTGPVVGDLVIPISELSPPDLQSLDYAALLKKKREAGVQPKLHEIAKLVPADQYFLQFNSMTAANELMDLSVEWGESLLRMLTVSARDHHLREKYEDQLCIKRGPLTRLFADRVISELAVTGSDFFIAEGTDLTLIFRLKKPDVFLKSAERWAADVKKKYPDMVEREFHYRGHKVRARYTNDRMVSSFVVVKGDYAIYSNSHVAIRKVVNTMIGAAPNLHAAADYRYVTTILPPSDDPQSGYLYGSEAFLKRLVSPAFKIGEKRRLQSFNNLVMLNNASLFYRLEHGKSPGTLSDLVEGRFINPRKIVCPHGGAYAFDAKRDTCTSSLYNRIKYLTPIVELNVLKVSSRERKEYNRYKQRYEAFWKGFFDPLAVRMTAGPRVKLETCVLPFANGSLYRDMRRYLDKKPHPISSAGIAKSAVASVVLVPGRKRVAQYLRGIPGVTEALRADPTLTDLSWLGDRVSLHFCDDDTILEIDPTRLKPITAPLPVSVLNQTAVAAALTATNLPVYLTIDVEDEGKARRMLKHLSAKIFLKGNSLTGLAGLRASLDGYRLPDYKKHPRYVFSYQFYAVKVRIYASLVGGKLVAATKPHILREVIDAVASPGTGKPRAAHAWLRLNLRAMNKLKANMAIYWAEKSRQASHRNIMPIYNLIKLYDVPIEKVNQLSDAKYGVTYFCPDGKYYYDADRDQVFSTVYGNRQHARQNLTLAADSTFSRFFNSLDELVASVRFIDDGLIATVEIVRRKIRE